MLIPPVGFPSLPVTLAPSTGFLTAAVPEKLAEALTAKGRRGADAIDLAQLDPVMLRIGPAAQHHDSIAGRSVDSGLVPRPTG